MGLGKIRDRWADDPYTSRPDWRQRLERRLEDIILSSASGLVAVFQTWAEFYGTRYRAPTLVVYNGFDPAAYRHAGTAGGEAGLLHIVYTGSVYAGRDPTPLWHALAGMGKDAETVRVEFYGAIRLEVHRLHQGRAVLQIGPILGANGCKNPKLARLKNGQLGQDREPRGRCASHRRIRFKDPRHGPSSTDQSL
jgi:hypothetical protein